MPRPTSLQETCNRVLTDEGFPFAKLPTELQAKVASFLPIQELRRLLETSNMCRQIGAYDLKRRIRQVKLDERLPRHLTELLRLKFRLDQMSQGASAERLPWENLHPYLQEISHGRAGMSAISFHRNNAGLAETSTIHMRAKRDFQLNSSAPPCQLKTNHYVTLEFQRINIPGFASSQVTWHCRDTPFHGAFFKFINVQISLKGNLLTNLRQVLEGTHPDLTLYFAAPVPLRDHDYEETRRRLADKLPALKPPPCEAS